jgi:hypothetical protein
MEVSEVQTWVFEEAALEDLNLIADQIRIRRDALARAQVRAFKPGDKVKWLSRRMGGYVYGTFVRLLQKNAEVLSTQGRWRVHPSLLEADEQPTTIG